MADKKQNNKNQNRSDVSKAASVMGSQSHKNDPGRNQENKNRKGK